MGLGEGDRVSAGTEGGAAARWGQVEGGENEGTGWSRETSGRMNDWIRKGE